MSAPWPAVAVAPGWYPDPVDARFVRWWSGREWTGHVQGAIARPAPPAVRRDIRTGTVWIWLITLSPLLSTVTLFVWNIPADVDVLLHDIARQAYDTGPFDTTILSIVATRGLIWYLIVLAVSALVYAAGVAMSARDAAVLRRRGVVDPFPWAWAFLAGSIYVIGRTVIARRRTGSDLGMLWVEIGLIVLVNVLVVVWLVVILMSVGATMASLSGGVISSV